MLSRGLGGLEQVLLDYDDALRPIGHDMHALIHPDAAVRPALEARSANWHGLPNGGAWDVLAALRLRKLLRQLRPDVCIAHGNRAMSLLRRAGAHPVIAVLPNYKMHCQGAAAVFHPTQDLKQYALKQGVPETRLHHIPSMVRVPTQPPARAMQSPPVIGAMGRFVAKKGFHIFIEALGRLQAQSVPFRATLAGDGPERGALERLVDERGLRQRLSLPGWIEDKAVFFSGIDVFCLPSLHEPFGIVLIEAMAHARAIVAAASEGPSEILRDGSAGVLVPVEDADRMAEALAALLADPERSVDLATHAYRRAHDRYGISCVARQIDHVLQDIVRQSELAATAIS